MKQKLSPLEYTNVLYEPKDIWSETLLQICSQLPCMQEEQTHNKVMQLNHQIQMYVQIKKYTHTYIHLISIPFTTLFTLIRSCSKFQCSNGNINYSKNIARYQIELVAEDREFIVCCISREVYIWITKYDLTMSIPFLRL